MIRGLLSSYRTLVVAFRFGWAMGSAKARVEAMLSKPFFAEPLSDEQLRNHAAVCGINPSAYASEAELRDAIRERWQEMTS
jgi:hypothetical protein